MGTYFFLSGNHIGCTYRGITSDDLTFCSGLKSDAFGFAELNCVSLNTCLDNHRKTYFTLGVATLGTPYFVSIPSYWYASEVSSVGKYVILRYVIIFNVPDVSSQKCVTPQKFQSFTSGTLHE